MSATPEDSAKLLSTTELITLFAHEAAAERAVADPNQPDPCSWYQPSVGWVMRMSHREPDPLPVAIPGGRGKGNSHRFDVGDAREWFAAEVERHLAKREAEILTGAATGVLMTCTMLARELGTAPDTLAKRLRDWKVQPARQSTSHTYYRLADMLGALQAAAKAEDPDSLPPTERDAHYRAEARKDDLMKSRRELIPVSEAIPLINSLASLLRDFYDLVEDTLETQCGLPPPAILAVRQQLDEVRTAQAVRLQEVQEQLLHPQTTGVAA